MLSIFVWDSSQVLLFETIRLLIASGAIWFQTTEKRKPGKRFVYRGSF